MNKLLLAAVSVPIILVLAGCAPAASEGQEESSAPTPTQTATPAPEASASGPEDAKLDAVALGEHCVALASTQDSGPVNQDPSATAVAVREADGLLFVTVPAQVEAVSGEGSVLMDGSVYCYLDPDSLEAVRDADYIATGFKVNLTGEEYETYLNTPNPPTSLLD